MRGRDYCDELKAAGIDFASLRTCANVNAEASHLESERAGAPNSPGGPIECSKEPVAGRVYLAAVETGEFAAHKIVVTVKQVVPATIAKRCGPFSGADDVRE